MKRKINIFLISVLCVSFVACIDDPGNYDYTNAENEYPAEVTGGLDTENGYTVKVGETLTIDPQMEEGFTESDYEYCWYAVPRLNYKESYPLGTERKLNCSPMDLPVGGYSLYFQIRDKKRDTYRYYSSKLEVITIYSIGWFVTKTNDNNETDIDMIDVDGKYFGNILSFANNGKAVPGSPRKTGFMYRTWNHVTYDGDGVAMDNALSVFFVATDKEIYAYEGIGMMLSKTTDELFYEKPAVIDVSDICCYETSSAGSGQALIMTLLVNDGGVHAFLPGMNGSSINIFTERLFSSDYNLKLAPYVCSSQNMMWTTGFGVMTFFDLNSNSFRKLKTNQTVGGVSVTSPFTDATSVTGAPNVNNMNYELVYMQESNLENYMYMGIAALPGHMTGGLGIMKSKSDGKYYGMRLYDLTYSAKGMMNTKAPAEPQPNPIAAFVAVPDGAVVSTAKVRGTHKTNSTIFCSAGDNKLHAYRVAQGAEELILTLDAGEEIAYVDDVWYSKTYPEVQRNFRKLVVLSNTNDGKWNLRLYDYLGSTDTPDTSSVTKYSGEGKASQVFYRGPYFESVF